MILSHAPRNRNHEQKIQPTSSHGTRNNNNAACNVIRINRYGLKNVIKLVISNFTLTPTYFNILCITCVIHFFPFTDIEN